MSFVPSPTEAEYNEALWAVADSQRQGQLAGGTAVNFFLNSGLQPPILKEIWGVADAQQQYFLTRAEFAVALRLIAMAQNGMPVSAAELQRCASVALPLPRFAGLPHSSGWTLTVEDRSKYEGLFPNYAGGTSGGRIPLGAGLELLRKSGLDPQVVQSIWELADVDKDNQLNLPEFCLAMHITVSCAKRGMTMPASLPISLAASVGVFPMSSTNHPAAAAAVAASTIQSVDSAFADLAPPMPTVSTRPPATSSPRASKQGTPPPAAAAAAAAGFASGFDTSEGGGGGFDNFSSNLAPRSSDAFAPPPVLTSSAAPPVATAGTFQPSMDEFSPPPSDAFSALPSSAPAVASLAAAPAPSITSTNPPAPKQDAKHSPQVLAPMLPSPAPATPNLQIDLPSPEPSQTWSSSSTAAAPTSDTKSSISGNNDTIANSKSNESSVGTSAGTSNASSNVGGGNNSYLYRPEEASQGGNVSGLAVVRADADKVALLARETSTSVRTLLATSSAAASAAASAGGTGGNSSKGSGLVAEKAALEALQGAASELAATKKVLEREVAALKAEASAAIAQESASQEVSARFEAQVGEASTLVAALRGEVRGLAAELETAKEDSAAKRTVACAAAVAAAVASASSSSEGGQGLGVSASSSDEAVSLRAEKAVLVREIAALRSEAEAWCGSAASSCEYLGSAEVKRAEAEAVRQVLGLVERQHQADAQAARSECEALQALKAAHEVQRDAAAAAAQEKKRLVASAEEKLKLALEAVAAQRESLERAKTDRKAAYASRDAEGQLVAAAAAELCALASSPASLTAERSAAARLESMASGVAAEACALRAEAAAAAVSPPTAGAAPVVAQTRVSPAASPQVGAVAPTPPPTPAPVGNPAPAAVALPPPAPAPAPAAQAAPVALTPTAPTNSSLGASSPLSSFPENSVADTAVSAASLEQETAAFPEPSGGGGFDSEFPEAAGFEESSPMGVEDASGGDAFSEATAAFEGGADPFAHDDAAGGFEQEVEEFPEATGGFDGDGDMGGSGGGGGWEHVEEYQEREAAATPAESFAPTNVADGSGFAGFDQSATGFDAFSATPGGDFGDNSAFPEATPAAEPSFDSFGAPGSDLAADGFGSFGEDPFSASAADPFGSAPESGGDTEN